MRLMRLHVRVLVEACSGAASPLKERVRQTYMPRAFMSIATSSRAPMPLFWTASRKACMTTQLINRYERAAGQ